MFRMEKNDTRRGSRNLFLSWATNVECTKDPRQKAKRIKLERIELDFQ